MKKIIIATNNFNKVKEIGAILNSNGKGDIYGTLKSEKIDFDVDETGLTFAQNAIKKAKEYYELCKKPVIAEDSGLCIDAFNGLPGIFSKRIYDGKSELEGNQIILDNLENSKNRNAHYKAVYAYYDGFNLIVTEGTMEGYITQDIAGENGFAYDKIFYSTELEKRVAEASDEEKKLCSHRRRGLEKLNEYLLEIPEPFKSKKYLKDINNPEFNGEIIGTELIEFMTSDNNPVLCYKVKLKNIVDYVQISEVKNGTYEIVDNIEKEA